MTRFSKMTSSLFFCAPACALLFGGVLTFPVSGQDESVPEKSDDGVLVRRAEIVDTENEEEEAPDIDRPSSESVPAAAEQDPVNTQPVKPEQDSLDDQEAPAEPVKPAPPKREPGDDLFDYAGVLYGKKFFDLASDKYETYLRTYSNGRHAEAALYRRAECSLKQNLKENALRDYKRLIKVYSRGVYTGPSAYRIASLAYNDQRFGYAAPYFKIAETNAAQPKLKITSLYYRARCLELDAQKKAAHAAYQEVVEVREDNAFWHKSLLALGRMDAAVKKKSDALKWFAMLAEEPKLEEIVGAVQSGGIRSSDWTGSKQEDLIEALGEATVKAGLLYSEAGETDKAIKLYGRMLKFDSAADWKALARYGLIRLHYDLDQFEEVIKAFAATGETLGPDIQPKMLIMVAKSYHELEQFSNAFDSYQLIERAFPESIEAEEAGYQKLRCQFVLGDPSLPGYADRFIDDQRQRDASSPFINMANFLKSEILFKQGKFADAADAYRALGDKLKHIPEKYHSMIYYKHGWAEFEAGNPSQAISPLSSFMLEDTESVYFANALAKRAMSYKAVEDFTNCLKDFDRIIRDFPTSEPAELSYQQKGLISGQRRDDDAMVATFEEMLEKFPTTSAKAQALFWIGFGKYRKKEYKECIEPLTIARKMDEEAYFENATRAIVHAQYRNAQSVTSSSKNDYLPPLISEINLFLAKKPEEMIPREILFWLGMKLFDQDDFANAAKYLTLASTPEKPEDSQLILWERLGVARQEIDQFDLALDAAEQQFAMSKSPAAEAKALLTKSRALAGQGNYDEARVAAREGSNRQKEGRIGAMLILQLGDVEFAEKNYQEAAELFIVPATTFDDPQITPLALWKTVRAINGELARMGENSTTTERGKGLVAKKTELETEISKRFPKFQPKET
ncbi:MAG: tetratricopeptide (TPR) repeat protein [Verrucomicrobiales bacterium]|jgi:tetratricopeptide (TPR) repeat protein